MYFKESTGSKGFLMGSVSAAYQVEGVRAEDGKSLQYGISL